MTDGEVPEDRLERFYALVAELIELRVVLGYDLDMEISGGRYRVRVTETRKPGVQ